MKKFWSGLNKNQKRNIIIGIVALIVGFIVYRVLKKRQYTNVPFDKNNIPHIQTGVSTSIPWNPRPLAEEIYENLEGYNLYVYPETSEKILKLNDDQIIYLYNVYNQDFAEEYDTLTQLFENEWNQSLGKYDKVVARLKSLGLK